MTHLAVLEVLALDLFRCKKLGSLQRASLASTRMGNSALTPQQVSHIPISGRGSLRWYALYTRSRHEFVIEKYLAGMGYLVCSPFYRTKRKRVDRVVEIELPLFPGYIFCQFDANERLPILMAPGVVAVVGGKGPIPVDDQEIASLQAVMQSGRPLQPWHFLGPGHRVRVRLGPFSGAEGTLVQSKNQRRLVVSISLLERSVAVELEQDFVEPLF
jgi:transcription antitermination factor NusG